ncbi:hypothetical protein G9A89_004085 [Geosiphon pyriformis]|nr:hypothetical protein G9A89_004085 [Geosiphon pyriformis]
MGACIKNNKKWPTATKYYCKWDNTPCLACGEILPDEGLWNDVPDRRGTCDEACQYTILINDWRMASAKAEGTTPEEIQEIKNNFWMLEYNRPDYPEDDFFTDDPNTFQN